MKNSSATNILCEINSEGKLSRSTTYLTDDNQVIINIKIFTFYLSLQKINSSLVDIWQDAWRLQSKCIMGIVGAVVIFDHGLKFGIIFPVSDHPAHEKLIAIKKKFITIE